MYRLTRNHRHQLANAAPIPILPRPRWLGWPFYRHCIRFLFIIHAQRQTLAIAAD